MGALYAQVFGLLIGLSLKITEARPLFVLLDLIFGPSPPEQSMDFTTLRVTTNLESALRHLRIEKESRTLWIDALCIDQSNEDEKGAQVQRMNQIYANAASTTIWLGGYHGLEEPERCGGRQSGECEHVRQIEAAYNYVSFLRGWRTFFRLNSDTNERRLFLASRQGLIDLAKRGWWERLWVIQEVALSTRRVYIQCGHKTSDFHDFTVAWHYLFRRYAELSDDLKSSIHIMTTIGDFRYSSDYDQLYPSAKSWYQEFRSWSLTNSFHGIGFAERLQLILLRTSGRFKCRDDRDRLYAVLGIAAGVIVRPRYKIPFFMTGPIAYPPTLVVYSLFDTLPIFSEYREILLFFSMFIINNAPSIWVRYYGSISRPEYITPGYIRDLKAFKGGEIDRAWFFTALAGNFAQGIGSLSFLDAISCSEDQEDTMPSWVPDWSKEISTSACKYAKRRDSTRVQITDSGKTLRVEGRFRTIVNVIRAADLQEQQSLSVWQTWFKKTVALPIKERPVLVRLLSELIRLTSPHHSSKLGRPEKWRALWLFFHISSCLGTGLEHMKSQKKTMVYTDDATAEGVGYLDIGKADKGNVLLSVPCTFYHMVLRRGKLTDRWRIVGLVDMVHTEDWAQLRKDKRLRVVEIE
ncbi:hypothetical protein HG530_008451 [Fusarium avenaceum]|nr:hypothetical protein HG530_008451 [Fusarium avenaceum]